MGYRILMLGPHLSVKGGITTVVETYQQYWDNKQFELRYIGTYIDTTHLPVKLAVYMWALVQMVYCLLAWRPHVVHLHVSQRGSFYRKTVCSALAKITGKSVLWHLHASEFDQFYNQSPRAIRSLLLHTLNQADVVLVLSAHWRSFLASIGVSTPIKTLHNPVVLPVERAAIDTASSNVLALGRLGERKGTYDILKAVPRIVERCPEARFWLAGDGEIDKVQAIIEENGLEKYVQVLGWLDQEAKADRLRQTSLLLLPSHREGQGIAILEAFSYGVPVIGSWAGGIPDVVADGVNGYLIEAGNVEALAERTNLLLQNPELRQTFGENGRQTIIAAFTIENILQQLYAIYQDLVTNS